MLKRSVGEDAPPLTTFQLRYPLQIHAELMTHRLFSRNARSSRAVPTARLIEEVRVAPFIPRYWGANQRGMQAGAEHDALLWLQKPVVDREVSLFVAQSHTNEEAWLTARDRAAEAAEAFATAGYHKQIANRLLAPFLHIDVVLTTTDLANWDALRIDPAAEPHIRDLAVAMRDAVEAYGEPAELIQHAWHLPYIEPEDHTKIGDYLYDLPSLKQETGERNPLREALCAVSVTRCAQVSYAPFHEAKLTIEQEIARHDALISARPMHASPAEHQATPDRIIARDAEGDPIWEHPKLHGNLVGWIQYRKTLAGERA